MMKTLSLLPVLTIALALLADLARAESIGINFVRGSSGEVNMDPADVAGVVVAQSNWNSVTQAAANGGSSPVDTVPVGASLVDDTGAETGAQVTWAGNTSWSTNNGTSNGDNKMMGGYLDDTGTAGATTITFSNIPYTSYDVYAYFGSDGDNRTGTISDGATVFSYSTNSQTGGGFPGAYAQTTDTGNGNPSANWAVWSAKTGASFTITNTRGSNSTGVHGIQIVEVNFADTDNDGLPDGWEQVIIGFDDMDAVDGLDDVLGPNDAGTTDFDNDGSPDEEEFTRSTDATDPDSDGDTLLDGVENNSGTWGGLTATGTSPLDPDSDGDTLDDNVENPDLPYVDASQPGTDPNIPDTDGDTLRDDWEVANTLDPTDDGTGMGDPNNGSAGDPDSDFSDNAEEQARGTMPREGDTDGDELLDGYETGDGSYVSATETGTNPLVPDSDGDGLRDDVENPTLPFVDENQPGTNPNLADSDMDTLTDGWEVANGFDPTSETSRPVADGGAIAINFGAGQANAVLDAADVAGVVGQANWNNASGATGDSLALTDQDGVASGAMLSWSTDEEWSTGTPVDSNGTLLTGWIAAQSNPATVEVSNIPYALYDLYVYINHDRNGEDVSLSDGGDAFTDWVLIENNTNTGAAVTWTQQAESGAGNGNFARFQGMSGDLDLTIASNDASNPRGPISGIQIVAAGSPGPFAITDIQYDGVAGEVSITWNSESGVTYGIEISTTLTPSGEPGGWEEIDDYTASGPSSTYEHAPLEPEVLPENLSYRIRDLRN